MTASPKVGDRRAYVEFYVGGYEPTAGELPPDLAPDGPWTVEEWDGTGWHIVGTAPTRADLPNLGVT
jgi:hypothetical protein